jgi:hypothetical protein
VVARDLPNGLKKGEVLNLSGRSEFEFKDGAIFKLTDISTRMLHNQPVHWIAIALRRCIATRDRQVM